MICFARSCFAAFWLMLLLTPGITVRAQGTASQTIQILPISDRPVTTAPFQVVALASSNLPVTLAVGGPAILNDRRLLTLTGVGQVTLTATQPGNTQYAAAAPVQLTFNVTQSPSSITWQPPVDATPYGTPLSAAVLSATATASPLVDPTADIPVITSQIGQSLVAPASKTVTYPASSAIFRYEGSTMAPLAAVPGSLIPNGMALPYAPGYRVGFTCDCQQFEFVTQSRGGTYRLWIDGAYTSEDATPMVDSYPATSYILVQFPDQRPRQIKLKLPGGLPFFGITTVGTDTVSAPQVPLGQRVIVFGDSWTGPTFAPAILPPVQDGLSGAGYAEVLGEYFNWEYWDSGIGGEGFTYAGTDVNGATFPQRITTDVCPFNPAAVVIVGGVNDSSTADVMQQGVTAALQNLQNCLPNTPVYLYGPQKLSSPRETGLAAAAAAFPAVHYVDMAAANWFYGDPASAAIGNDYLYLNGHPTPLGHNYLAEQIAADLTAAFPSLAPTPYSVASATPLAGAFTYSAAAGALLPAGANSVTATFTPTDTVNYASATLSSLITITQAGSTTVVTPLMTNGMATIGIVVQPQIQGTPTGSVVVSEAGVPLATLALSNGSASYTGTTLANGSHTLTFSYSGDNNFTASSAATAVTIAVVPPDFTMSAGASTLSILPGTQGTVSLLITPASNLAATLNLTCTGLPANAGCAFAGGSAVAVAGAPITASVIITVPSAQTAFNTIPGGWSHRRALESRQEHSLGRNPNGSRERGPGSSEKAALCGMLGAGLLAFGSRTRRGRAATMLAATTLSALAMMLGGCGGGASPVAAAPVVASPVSYTVQLQLTSASNPSITHATSVMLTVQ